MGASKRKAATPARDGAMAFFDPRDASDLALALAWLDAQSPNDASDGPQASWSVLALPEPRIHPRAPALFASAAGVAPSAIAAVLDGRAFIDDDRELRLWPWYPEEDAEARPLAKEQAEALGLALPREYLDEPYEPAHYLARSGQDAIERWLRARGIDATSTRIDRVPIPPRRMFPEERFEGGMSARSRVMQAVNAVAYTTRLFQYAGENAEHRAYLTPRLDKNLARLFAQITGDDGTVSAPSERPWTVPPYYPEEAAPIGRVSEVFAVRDGALLATDGALILMDRAGTVVASWRRPFGAVFAREDLAILGGDTVLDLSTHEFVVAELDPLLARMGLAAAPDTSEHAERTAPVLSACGRYVLDVDESPYIVRMSDGVTVAEGGLLEKSITPPAKHGTGLVAPGDVAVGESTILDGVRFVVRSGESPVRDDRSLAFALAGARWRILAGSVVREGGRVIARLGISILTGAFSPDGAELWALGSDHAIHVVFEPVPRIVTIAPLEPVLRDAVRLLTAGSGNA